MAELVEYGLVVLLSTFVMGFSIVGYTSFASTVSSATNSADSSSYIALAFAAMQKGNSSGTLTLQDATLSCVGGTLLFSSHTVHSEDELPVGCQFSFPDLNGAHQLEFSYSAGLLDLRVS